MLLPPEITNFFFCLTYQNLFWKSLVINLKKGEIEEDDSTFACSMRASFSQRAIAEDNGSFSGYQK